MNLLSLLSGFILPAHVVSLHVPERPLGSKSNANVAIELQADAAERRYPSARTSKELMRSESRERLEEHTLSYSLDAQELATSKSHNVGKKVDPDDTNNGVCQKTSGLQMDGGVYVLAIEDLSVCEGHDVKDFGMIRDANIPLQACSMKVAKDPECSSKFTMETVTNECKCVKKEKKCKHKKSTTTCVYQLVPPVCANTTGIALSDAGNNSRVQAVYPVQFNAKCSNATSLGRFPDGVKSCAAAVAKKEACGHQFEFHRTEFSCHCLIKNRTCTSQDSKDFCLYELTSTT